MTHTQLVKNIAKKIDLKPPEVAILWQQASHIMTKELAAQEKIRIKNFGAFVVVKHKSRTVPDPRELSKKLVIFDQNLPKFRPSEQLRAKVKDVIPSASSLAEVKTDDEPEAASELTVEETPSIKISEASTTQSTPKDNPADETSQKTKQPKNQTNKEDADFLAHLPKSLDVGFAELAGLTVDQSVLDLVPFHIAEKFQLVPIEKKDNELIVATTDPGDREALEIVGRQTGLKISPKVTTQSDVQHVLDQYKTGRDNLTTEDLAVDGGENPSKEPSADDNPNQSDSPAAKIVSNLLERAVREKASDIHIEPEEKKIMVRFRIDGILQPVIELPKNIQASLTSRLKILATLKIDESRLPQDGRIRLVVDHKEVDFRVSTLPTVAGEKIVMRILDKSGGVLGFEELGLDGRNMERVNDNITKAHGMVLVTGPTGSGKTTTLYAVLGKLMNPTVNVVTLEDPVEYRITGINQSQVNAPIGFDFASGLRSIVRQDPDIILIGEIRDLETATMAVHSALTGHIVLSTLHTNDAAGAIPRLIDMGIEPFLITSSTNAIVAQRLVRKICQNCKESVILPDESLTEVRAEIERMPEALRPKSQTLTFSKGKGCPKCNKSGYVGRFGIFETLSVTEEIKQLALKRVSASILENQAIKEGMITLKQDGILKALAGQTTLEEVWRVTKD